VLIEKRDCLEGEGDGKDFDWEAQALRALLVGRKSKERSGEQEGIGGARVLCSFLHFGGGHRANIDLARRLWATTAARCEESRLTDAQRCQVILTTTLCPEPCLLLLADILCMLLPRMAPFLGIAATGRVEAEGHRAFPQGHALLLALHKVRATHESRGGLL
jgi:hypothetical protein